MKQPTLQKVMLTTVALLGSLALTAQAGHTHATVSSAVQTHGSHGKGQKPTTSAKTSFHKILFPNSTYMLDDGSAEDSVGFGNGLQNFQSIFLNHFTVIPGQTTITAVEVAWGTPNFPDPTLNGEPVTIGIWSDPNGDGQPFDAALLGSVTGTIQNAGTDTFVTYTFATAVNLPAGATSFFVGDLTEMNNGPEQFPQGFDETHPQMQSFISANSDGSNVDFNNPGNNTLVGTIEDLSGGTLSGNWMIRADTGNGSPTPTPTPTATPTPTGTPGNALWYNGDFNGVNGLANEDNDSLGAGEYAHTYDDFNVTDSSGWDVGSVFSNNLENLINVTGATWEIRQGISEGNGGTVIASGMTATPTVTPTGRSGFGFTEYQVLVGGLSVHLPQGTYFLNVTPIGDGVDGRSFVSTTSGANCVGTPCGNDQNAFFDSNFFGADFQSTADQGQPYDFSMGVNSTGGGGGGLTLSSSASRLAQGSSSFDIPLPGVEDRDAPSRDLIVFTFNEAVTGASGATTSCGTVQSVTVDPSNPNSLLVKITALSCNEQTVTVTVNGVTAGNGDTLASASTMVTFLFGDVNGDGSVNNQDIQGIRAAMGQHTNSSNFRADLNGDGAINNKDVGIFKTFRGDMAH